MHNERFERDDPGIEVFDVEAPRASRSRTDRAAADRRRRGVNWRPISLLAAAALAAVAVVALADYRPSALPSPSAATTTATPVATTASPSPTAEAASAPATLGPYWPAQIDLPVITVPAEAARVAAIQPDTSVLPAGSSSGPFLYWPLADAPRTVNLVDIGRNTQTAQPLPLKKGEQFMGSATDGAWLAVVAGEADRRCGPDMPWRLLVARVGPDGLPVGGTGGFAQVARGKAIGHKVPDQGDCLVTPAPQFKLVAGRLAWTEESSSGGGSVVRVRALDQGGTTSFASEQHAVELALSAEAVAWVASPDPTAGAFPAAMPRPGVARPDWQVMEVGPGDAAPHSVDLGVSGTGGGVPLPQVVLNGSAVVASLVGQDLSTASVVQVDAAGLTVIDDGSHGRSCTASAAADGVVLLACGWPGITRTFNGQDTPVWMGAAWTPSGGLRVVTLGTDEPTTAYGVLAAPGWAVLVGDQSWTAIPMSALTPP
jgi:hypothetical protein